MFTFCLFCYVCVCSLIHNYSPLPCMIFMCVYLCTQVQIVYNLHWLIYRLHIIQIVQCTYRHLLSTHVYHTHCVYARGMSGFDEISIRDFIMHYEMHRLPIGLDFCNLSISEFFSLRFTFSVLIFLYIYFFQFVCRFTCVFDVADSLTYSEFLN